MAEADSRYDENDDSRCTFLECETDCSLKSHGINDLGFEQQTTQTPVPVMAVTSPVLIGFRHVQAFLLFLCLVVTIIDRVNDPVGLKSMAKYDLAIGEVDLIQKSFYWGMCVSPVIGGYVCHKLGAKIPILISTFGSSVLYLITPYVIGLGVGILVGITFIRGMFQALLIPCVYDHIAKWAPIAERNRLGAFSFLGIELGIILGIIYRDFIAELNLVWVSILITPGALSLVWCLLWAVLADDNPAVSRFTSIRERAFIQASQENMNWNNNQQKRYPIPWKAIFTSVPFYSLMVVQMTYAFGANILRYLLPVYYMMFIRGMFMSPSFFFCLPFLATFVMSIVFLVFADILLLNKIISLTVLRKTIMSISSLIPAAILIIIIIIGLLDQNQNVVVYILMIVSVGFSGGEVIGSGLNAIDLSSNHVAILTGVITMAKHLAYNIASMSVQLVFAFEREKTNWLIFFFIVALVFIFGNLQFIFFGSTTSQPWNEANLSHKRKNCGVHYKGPTRNRIESIAEETEAA